MRIRWDDSRAQAGYVDDAQGAMCSACGEPLDGAGVTRVARDRLDGECLVCGAYLAIRETSRHGSTSTGGPSAPPTDRGGIEMRIERRQPDQSCHFPVAPIDGRDPAAVALGRRGGLAKSEAKARAARENGRKGGKRRAAQV